MLSRVWASLFLWNLASLEKENVPSMVDANVGICFPNRRERERYIDRERERAREQMASPLTFQALELYL
jgi:hypothetical protein